MRGRRSTTLTSPASGVPSSAVSVSPKFRLAQVHRVPRQAGRQTPPGQDRRPPLRNTMPSTSDPDFRRPSNCVRRLCILSSGTTRGTTQVPLEPTPAHNTLAIRPRSAVPGCNTMGGKALPQAWKAAWLEIAHGARRQFKGQRGPIAAPVLAEQWPRPRTMCTAFTIHTPLRRTLEFRASVRARSRPAERPPALVLFSAIMRAPGTGWPSVNQL